MEVAKLPVEEAKKGLSPELVGHLTAANAAWPKSAQEQMLKMVDEIASRDNYIKDLISTNQGIPVKAGFAAEEIHAETFNLDAILQEKTARALTARNLNSNLSKTDHIADGMIVDNGEVAKIYQDKYWATAQKTAKEMRRLNPDGSHHYDGADGFVGPSDQVNPTDGSASISDNLHRTKLHETSHRQSVADAADYVGKRVTDRYQHDGIESRPTTLQESRSVAKDNPEGRALRQDYQNQYMQRSTLQQMGKAAAGAAAISAIIAGTLSTTQYLKLVKEGKITQGEAVKGILKTTAVASADSALKAAAATGAVSTVTRLAPQLVAQQSMKAMLLKGTVGGAAICAVDAIECLVLVAAGKMTPAQMETRVGKNVFQTSGAVFGSSIGTTIAASLGATAGLAPILAGVAGALIGGIAVSIAIENGIEKPYREVMSNTVALTSAGEAMTECSQAFEYGQKALAGFMVIGSDIDASTAVQFTRLDDLGDELTKAIERI